MREHQKQLASQLATCLAAAAESMLGQSWMVDIGEPEAPDSADMVCWAQRLNLHKEPLIYVAAPLEPCIEIGSSLLRQTGNPSPDESECRAAYGTLLANALAGFARYLSEVCATGILLESGSEVPTENLAAGSAPLLQSILVTGSGDWQARFLVRFERALLHAVSGGPTDQEAGNGSDSDVAITLRTSAATTAQPSFDLLLDVEMPVSVSFGRTQLPLKDVIKLNTGSIVELNRTISEPVEVIVNNCVIARGEVVVVDGNYGVRIQQIISRAERLRSMD